MSDERSPGATSPASRPCSPPSLAVASPGSAAARPSPPIGPLPLLGAADPETTLMGAAPGGRGRRSLGLPAASARGRRGQRRDSRSLEFGPVAEPRPARSASSPSCATPTPTGWQVFDTPVDENGQSLPGPGAEPRSRRGSPTTAGGCWSAATPSRPAASRSVVLAHDPGGDWHALPAARPDVLLPAEGEAPAEAPGAENRGRERSPTPPSTKAGAHRAALRARTGARSPTGSIHFDGERMDARAGRGPGRLGSASSTSSRSTRPALGNAWAIAEADHALDRSVVLLRADLDRRKGPLWVERPLSGAAVRRPRQRRAQGIAGAGAGRRRGAAAHRDLRRRLDRPDGDDRRRRPRRHPLLRHRRRRGDRLLVRRGAPAPRPLGVKLSRQGGYRSFAWPGGGFGTPDRSPTRSTRAAARTATAAPTCASPKARSRGCRAAAATSAAAAPSRTPTAAGSRGRSRSRRRPRPRGCSPGRSRSARR